MRVHKDSLRDFWDNINHTNISIIVVPEGEEREQGVEGVFNEIVAKNSLNLRKEIDFQVQEAQRVIKQDESKETRRASLVAQWLRICLPMQGTQVRALVWEDPTCRGATRPVSHNY